VVTRAGFSTISELAAAQKLSVVIPMPNSHQMVNGQYLFFNRAAAVIRQETLTSENFVKFLRTLIFEHDLQKKMKQAISKLMPKGASKKIAQLIINMLENGKNN